MQASHPALTPVRTQDRVSVVLADAGIGRR